MSKHPCPDRETLVAYASGALGGDAGAAVDRHLRGCDRCLHECAAMTAALAAGRDAAIPVPAAVRRRAAEAAGRAWRARLRAAASWRGKVPAWMRLPVMAPAAAAGLVLIALAFAPGGPDLSRAPYDGTRGVAIPGGGELVVTGERVPLRERPSDRARTLAWLPRHTRVRAVGENSGWLEVVTADGMRGWVDPRDVAGRF